MVSHARAFPTLTELQLARLADFGNTHQVDAGDLLYQEGDRDVGLVVILDGEAEARFVDPDDPSSAASTVISTHGAGAFLNELNVLTGQRVMLRALMRTEGRILRIEADEFRRLLASDPEIGDIIFAAFMERRELLRQGDAAASLRIVGSDGSPRALELIAYVRRQRLAHQWLDPDRDDEAPALLKRLGVSIADCPVVISLGAVLVNPTVAELAAHLGLSRAAGEFDVLDVVIVGGGPAGLAAAVYGASEGLDTLLVDRVGVGGQAGASSRIENFVGFPAGISGGELVERAAFQAHRLGARIATPVSVTGIEATSGGYRINVEDGDPIATRAIVLAMGVQYRKLPLDRLEEFEGAGVYYAATDLEARVCGRRPVTVIGGGNSAGQAAVFLAGRGCHVTVVIRGGDLTNTMSRYLIDRIHASDAIAVRPHTEVTALFGDERLAEIAITDNTTGTTSREQCVGLFSFIGAVPFTDWLRGFIELDDHGFIPTDRDLTDVAFDPLPFETSRPGVFAAGDVRAQTMKRVAAAVGDGSSAIRSVHQRLSSPVTA